MKTISTEVIVSNTKTTVTYACEHPGCSFVACNPSACKSHEYYKHRLKAESRSSIGGHQFFLIESKQDLEDLIDNALSCEYDTCRGEFEVPGWYGAEVYEDSGNYRYSDGMVCQVKPISEFIDMWAYEISELEENLKKADAMLKDTDITDKKDCNGQKCKS